MLARAVAGTQMRFPMARLPYLTHSDLAPEHKDLLKRDITLHRQLVHSPSGFRAFHTLSEYIRYGSKVDPRLRELAILQVGYLTRSPYEWSHHIKLGYDFGVSDGDIRALICGPVVRSSTAARYRARFAVVWLLAQNSRR